MAHFEEQPVQGKSRFPTSLGQHQELHLNGFKRRRTLQSDEHFSHRHRMKCRKLDTTLDRTVNTNLGEKSLGEQKARESQPNMQYPVTSNMSKVFPTTHSAICQKKEILDNASAVRILKCFLSKVDEQEAGYIRRTIEILLKTDSMQTQQHGVVEQTKRSIEAEPNLSVRSSGDQNGDSVKDNVDNSLNKIFKDQSQQTEEFCGKKNKEDYICMVTPVLTAEKVLTTSISQDNIKTLDKEPAYEDLGCDGKDTPNATLNYGKTENMSKQKGLVTQENSNLNETTEESVSADAQVDCMKGMSGTDEIKEVKCQLKHDGKSSNKKTNTSTETKHSTTNNDLDFNDLNKQISEQCDLPVVSEKVITADYGSKDGGVNEDISAQEIKMCDENRNITPKVTENPGQSITESTWKTEAESSHKTAEPVCEHTATDEVKMQRESKSTCGNLSKTCSISEKSTMNEEEIKVTKDTNIKPAHSASVPRKSKVNITASTSDKPGATREATKYTAPSSDTTLKTRATTCSEENVKNAVPSNNDSGVAKNVDAPPVVTNKVKPCRSYDSKAKRLDVDMLFDWFIEKLNVYKVEIVTDSKMNVYPQVKYVQAAINFLEQQIPDAMAREEVLIVNTGTNDVGYNRAPYYQVIPKFRQLESILKAKNYKQIALSGICNIYKNYPEPRKRNTSENIRRVNSAISSICKKNGWAYIDHDNIDFSCVSNNGPFLNRKGINIFHKNIENCIHKMRDHLK